VAGSCKHSNEPSASITVRNSILIEWLLTYQGLSFMELGGLSNVIPNIVQPSLKSLQGVPVAFFSRNKHGHIQVLQVSPF
jgi:hypothetical protein